MEISEINFELTSFAFGCYVGTLSIKVLKEDDFLHSTNYYVDNELSVLVVFECLTLEVCNPKFTANQTCNILKHSNSMSRAK